MKNKPSCIDLFSGAGGLSCGLEQAGFDIKMGVEYIPTFAETFKLNHAKAKTCVGDIRQVDGEKIMDEIGFRKGELDLLAGGPPCQGFSINAPIRSLADQRNHLFEEYMRLAEIWKPKTILIENVPGMQSLGKGTVVKAILSELKRMGYKTTHRILFAAHYGVPQIRYRTVFLASRTGKQIDIPYPTHNAKSVANFTGGRELTIKTEGLLAHGLRKHTSVWEALSDLPATPAKLGDAADYSSEPKNEYQKTLRGGQKKVDNHHCSGLAKINFERMKHIPQGGSWRDIPFDLLPKGLKKAKRTDHTKRYGRLHPEGMCSTVLTKCDPHWGSFFHPYQNRIITIREAARIQSFPDRFVFLGSMTDQYEQVGNAVPPLMAKAIGGEIMKALGE